VGVVFLMRHPLALLTLFVYVGLFKEQAVVRALPVDATLAVGVLLLAVCFPPRLSARAARSRSGSPAPWPDRHRARGERGWDAVGQKYGTERAWKFVTLTTLAAIAPLFIRRGRARYAALTSRGRL
jgi:hypothetical protein